jgi:hypothetical protein
MSLCLLSAQAFAQTGTYWSHRNLMHGLEEKLIEDRERDHLSIRPLMLRNIPSNALVQTDSTVFLSNLTGDFWQAPEPRNWKMDVLPLVHFGGGYSTEADAIFRSGAGFAASAQYGPKWKLYVDVFGGVEKLPAYVQQFVDSLGVVPSMGRNLGSGDQVAYVVPTFRLSYAPNEYFEFETGYGRNFFGEGHRSLFLSDVAYNNAYFKIATDVWHFKYINLFTANKDVQRDPTDPGTFENKYTAMHYLSWAITPWLNMGLFESVVWQGRDTLSQRGFDPNYLNPIIFYRPVEFSLGSPDNVLIGVDLNAKVGKRSVIYGQLLFDEFLLSAFRERNGWWGNKFGVQLGVKSFDAFNIQGLRLQAEYNTARPFTYTHGSVLQNFGHFNQPMAHILGTNFHEGLAFAYYEKDGWYADAQWMYAQYGRDPDSLNMGGDIFRSYVGPAMQYGNETGQGIGHQLFLQTLTAGRVINQAINLRLAFSYTYRRLDVDGAPAPAQEHIFGIQFSSSLYNDYRDF